MTASPKSWRIRASQAGGYLDCDYRAALDRAIHLGAFVLDEADAAAVEAGKASSPEADFGTCVHYELQSGLRCKFPGPPDEFAPDPEQWLNAARAAGGDLETCKTRVRVAAEFAAKFIPAVGPDGLPWLAEPSFETRDSTGHIDFLSQDFTHFKDLKTTGRPPVGNKLKPSYLIQQLIYANLVEDKTGVRPTTAEVVTVDRDAQWAMVFPLNLADDGMVFLAQQLRTKCKLWRGKNAMLTAMPRLGAHCGDGWCPYKAICRDKLQPAPAEKLGTGRAFATGTTFTL